jgi:3-hydroxyacyl-CoA dehydrogenase
MIIHKAAVIGAGTMGAQIAAHLANVGIPTYLLDIAPSELTEEEKQKGLSLQDPAVRNRVTQNLWDRARKLSPSPLFTPEVAQKITIGNVSDNLAWLSEVDWIVEAILERIELKRDIHAKIAQHARPNAIVSTNTSGLPIHSIAQEMSSERRKRFFGSHFFNPPRYMRLLEVIPTNDTDPSLVNEFCDFGERVLGKGIVRAKDTPGFIGNRIGCFDMQHAYWLTLTEGLSIEEVDAITGPAMGRPRSATFRLSDIVGVDLMAQIGLNLSEALKSDDHHKIFRQPEYIAEMVKRGWFGEKKGQGFYKRVQIDGKREIHALDYKTMEYHLAQSPQFPILDAIRKVADPAERIRQLCFADEKAGHYAWKQLIVTLCYAVNRLNEIADDIVAVDNALKWGFNWELGPFEIWDALGVKKVVARLESEGRPVPPLVKQLLKTGKSSFYEERGVNRHYFDFKKNDYVAEKKPSFDLQLAVLRKNQKVIRSNPGASLIDLGDGVAGLEFHSKMNVIGPDQLAMMKEAKEEVLKNFIGLVIGNQGDHFSAGANLTLFLADIEKKNWKKLDEDLQIFQEATSSLRRFEKPIVVACHGYVLGGGCEVSLGSNYVSAAPETYMSLPEVGVGVIPAAGGTKEMLIRFTENIGKGSDFFPGVKKAWEAIWNRKISSSASEASQLGYIRACQLEVVLNRDWLIGKAKARVLEILPQYQPDSERKNLPSMGEKGLDQFRQVLANMKAAKEITEYDAVVGERLAWVLCGGNDASFKLVSEQHVMDLEREAFLSLCGNVRTVERIQHILKTGKPLKN